MAFFSKKKRSVSEIRSEIKALQEELRSLDESGEENLKPFEERKKKGA
jgi:hypothetical protein